MSIVPSRSRTSDDLYEPDAISGRMHGSNPHLDDRRPIDVLAEGDLASVMAAVQAARTGAYA